MIEVRQITDFQLIKQLMMDKGSFYACMDDEAIKQYEENIWEPNKHNYKYLLMLCDGEYAGILRCEPKTSVMWGVHSHLLPKYYGLGISDEFQKAFEQWLIKNTKVHKIYTEVPAPCKHVLKAAGRFGYEIEGIYIGGIYWRGKIENLIIISKFIKRT